MIHSRMLTHEAAKEEESANQIEKGRNNLEKALDNLVDKVDSIKIEHDGPNNKHCAAVAAKIIETWTLNNEQFGNTESPEDKRNIEQSGKAESPEGAGGAGGARSAVSKRDG